MKQTPEERKTKEQLAAENAELRARLAELEAERRPPCADSGRAQAKSVDEPQPSSRTRTAELRKTMETLSGERQRFREVLDMLPAHMALLTPDYHVRFANKFFRDRFGEDNGKRCYEYLFGRTEPCELCENYKVLETMTPHEWDWTGPDGRDYHIYVSPFPEGDGSTLIMEVGLDVTEQKKAQAALHKAHDEMEQRVRKRTEELQNSEEELAAHNEELLTITENLRQSEERYRSLFTGMNEGFALHEIVHDRSGKAVDYVILQVNPAFEKVTGVKGGGIVGKKASVAYGTGAAPYLDVYAKVATTGKPASFETYFAPLDKHFAISVFSPDKGKFATVFQDITERKKAEEALRKLGERERFLADVIEKSAAPMGVGAPNGRLIECNPAFEKLTGYTREELLSGRVNWATDLTPDEWLEPELQILKEAVLSRKPVQYEKEYIRKDGSRVPIELTVQPIFENDRDLKFYYAFITDITKRKRAQEGLLRASDEWERTFNSVPDLIAILDENHHVVRANRPMAERLRTEPDKCVGLLCYEAVHGTDKPPDDCPHLHCMLDNREHKAEVHEERLGGDFLVTATPLLDAAGKIIGSVHVARDITEQKKREKELLQLNRTFRALSNSNQAMMHAVDEAGLISSVCKIIINDCGHSMVWVGFAADDKRKTVRPVAYSGFEAGYIETLGVTWSESDERGRGPTGTSIRTGKTFICRNILTDPAFKPWREQAVKRGYSSSIAMPLMHDGKAFGAIMIYSKEPNPFTENEVKLLEELADDLSYGIQAIRLREAHARTEENLRETGGYLQNLLDYANAPIIVWDAHLKITRFNHAFERLTGHKASDIIGKPLDILFPENSREDSLEDIWRTLSGERWDVVEIPILRTDGTVRTVLWNSANIHDKDGKTVLATIAQGQDITERKQAEEESEAAKISAEKAKEAAEAASRAKDHFLAVLSHELRTPLAPVVGMVSLLQKDKRFDSDTREGLEMIRRNVELEARLIDDLLDVTRIERGKIELDQQAIDLCTIMRRAVEVCMADIKERNLNLAMDAPEESHIVYADPVRLQQVFWNLVKNSVKFTEPGGRISIRCRREGDTNVVVEVSDTGRGIKPELMPRLFRAFEQGERPTGLHFGGLGLGLAISKALVEMHGGTLTARSEGEDKGATFAVRLPILPDESAVKTPEAAHQQPLPAQPRSLRILLVEDHENTARMMSLLLSSLGHEVRTAGDVKGALRLAGEGKRGNFDLLISDLGLPDGSGLDLMRQLRKKGHSLPGIALSGYGTEQDIEQSRLAGFAEHLVKPVDMSHVENTITKLFIDGDRQ